MPHREEYSEFTPSEYPSFPDSPEFPTVELQDISLQRLVDHDEAEEQRVFEACKGRGFFYLNLTGPDNGETILKGSEEIAHVGERFMALPTEEKMKFTPRQKELFGYVGSGCEVEAVAKFLVQIQDERRNQGRC